MSGSELRFYLQKMKKDPEGAFRYFYNQTYERIFRIAFYYAKREDLAQEIAIDAYMNLWNKRDDLADMENLDGYLYAVTKNAALNTLAKEGRYDSESIDNRSVTEGISDSPEEVLISEELFARYVKALDRLPIRCRQVFISLREERKTYAQVAQEMGISEKTVDAHLQKALKLLREWLC